MIFGSVSVLFFCACPPAGAESLSWKREKVQDLLSSNLSKWENTKCGEEAVLHCTLVCDSAAMHRAVSEQVQKNAKKYAKHSNCSVCSGSRQQAGRATAVGFRRMFYTGDATCWWSWTPPPSSSAESSSVVWSVISDSKCNKARRWLHWQLFCSVLSASQWDLFSVHFVAALVHTVQCIEVHFVEEGSATWWPTTTSLLQPWHWLRPGHQAPLLLLIFPQFTLFNPFSVSPVLSQLPFSLNV